MTLGDKIRKLRLENNMSMDDLASCLGVQRSAVNKYEKGIVVNLKRSTISSLARVFNVSPSYFLDDDDGLENLSDEERKLLTAYRSADLSARDYALMILESSAAKREEKRTESAI